MTDKLINNPRETSSQSQKCYKENNKMLNKYFKVINDYYLIIVVSLFIIYSHKFY